jgi:hypothetical protein
LQGFCPARRFCACTCAYAPLYARVRAASVRCSLLLPKPARRSSLRFVQWDWNSSGRGSKRSVVPGTPSAPRCRQSRQARGIFRGRRDGDRRLVRAWRMRLRVPSRSPQQWT